MTTIGSGPWAIFLRSRINHQIERSCHNWSWKEWRRPMGPSTSSHYLRGTRIQNFNHETALTTRSQDSWRRRVNITRKWDKGRTIQHEPAEIIPSLIKIRYLSLIKWPSRGVRIRIKERWPKRIYSHSARRSRITTMLQDWVHISSTDFRANIYRM